MYFSVLTEPVIPVWLNGREQELGLREVFNRAEEIQDIQGVSPLERYAVLRFLIAFSMDMLHLRNSGERRKLFRAGKFDMEQFDAYITECEKEGSKFDLFDKKYPFMQARYDEELDAKAEKPVAYLLHDLPTGNNHIFLDHRGENVHQLTPAQAFRAICATYVFCAAGAQGYPSSVNNTPPVYAIAIGDTLFETIVMNMLSIRECGNMEYGEGDVPWRKEEPVIPRQEYAEVTELDALTWMPRRITLIPDSDGKIRRIYFQQGRNFKGNSLWKDPHVPYRKKTDDTFASVKPETGRAFWRDAGTLIYGGAESTVYQPQVLRCIRDMELKDDDEFIHVRMTGLVTNNAQYVEWIEDELTIPSYLMQEETAAELFRSDAAMIEKMQQGIFSVIKKGIGQFIAAQAQMVFLSLMHEMLFGNSMQEICQVKEIQDEQWKHHMDSFHKSVWQKTEQALNQTLMNTGSSMRMICLQENIKKDIYIRYRKFVKEREALYE